MVYPLHADLYDRRMSSLSLYAGSRALRQIREHGLRQQDIELIVGASGGPKWFVLYGLDRYLMGEFFAERRQPLHLLGSSAGAWRLACLAHSEPLAAIERLQEHYSAQRYSANPDRREVSTEARRLLDRVLGDDGASAIATNPVMRLNIVADRSRGFLRSEHRLALAGALGLCGLANAASRRTLRWFFERVIFHNAVDGGGPVMHPRDMPTRYVPLSRDNVREALIASGSIPLVMEGVRNIPGAPGGIYRDGGITDYHFDLPFSEREGLVLYPHFYRHVTPGWFDKHLRWRHTDPANFDNVVLVAPSRDFVAGLPYGKIPDRGDFQTLDPEARQRYWRQTLDASRRLGDEFAALIERGDIAEALQPL